MPINIKSDNNQVNNMAIGLSRLILYCSGLVVVRVTAGLSRAGCGLPNGCPIPYRINL